MESSQGRPVLPQKCKKILQYSKSSMGCINLKWQSLLDCYVFKVEESFGVGPTEHYRGAAFCPDLRVKMKGEISKRPF